MESMKGPSKDSAQLVLGKSATRAGWGSRSRRARDPTSREKIIPLFAHSPFVHHKRSLATLRSQFGQVVRPAALRLDVPLSWLPPLYIRPSSHGQSVFKLYPQPPPSPPLFRSVSGMMPTFAQHAAGTGAPCYQPYPDSDGSIAQPHYSLDYNAYGAQQLPFTTLEGAHYALHQSSNWEPEPVGLYNN